MAIQSAVQSPPSLQSSPSSVSPSSSRPERQAVPCAVLAFDGALVADEARLAAAVQRIYREVRLGRPVAAVVSAQLGLADAAAPANALWRALDEVGVPAALLCTPGAASDVAAGTAAALADKPVVVLPGPIAAATPGRIVVERSRRLGRSPLTVALLGLGTVGLGVFRALALFPERYRIVGVAVEDRGKPRPADVPAHLLTFDPWELLDRPADVVVELIGGKEPAAPLLRAALASGRHVVTANKEVLADVGEELESRAAAAGVELAYSAAVGGSVPMLERVRRLVRVELAGPDRVEGNDPIERIEGVLNGTSNFVLDRLAAGVELAAAVEEAQDLGFAEADPSRDLSGADAAAKLVLLAHAAFGVRLDLERIACRGIEELTPAIVRAATDRGEVIRLVASAAEHGGQIAAEIAPRALAADHPLAQVRGEENRCRIVLADGESVVLSGRGAGRAPTSLAVVADVSDIADLCGRPLRAHLDSLDGRQALDRQPSARSL